MKTRLLSLLTVLTVLVALTGTVYARPQGPEALVYVAVSDPGDMDRFAATGLPAYARLHGGGETYLLARADAAGLQALRAAGLTARVVDADTEGANYYLARLAPHRPTPAWQHDGRLLLDDGVQVLLRAAPQAAQRLAQAGVDLWALPRNPIVLYPAAPAGGIPTAVDPDPTIQLMIDQVVSDTVYQYTGGLSGEWPVDIGGSPYTIATRYTYSGESIERATQYVGERLSALGLDVEYHQWGGSTYPNVIGEITGQINPDDIYIICGHLDDKPEGPLAPGADDNASGSVATLLAAEIMSQYQWGCTLRFALWTGEEQWLLGSEAYAERAYQNGENILGVLNLDMIAWDEVDGPDMDLHANSDLPETLVLAQLFADVVDTYNLDLTPHIIPDGITYSDHASFWNYGYTAILGIEYYSGGDFNDYYHTVNDRLQYLNLPY
ncbi:MAG: M28 family peptidase, partial [Anaerolineae bacterium]|nr:M28 family peptidase [Anaerolineae bacterium]